MKVSSNDDDTHSNYQTQWVWYCYLLSLPPRVKIGWDQSKPI